jgi:hypothetical protein
MRRHAAEPGCPISIGVLAQLATLAPGGCATCASSPSRSRSRSSGAAAAPADRETLLTQPRCRAGRGGCAFHPTEGRMRREDLTEKILDITARQGLDLEASPARSAACRRCWWSARCWARWGEDPYEVSSEERINRRPGPRGYRHDPRCFCASSYKPMKTMVRDRSRRVLRWSMGRCEDAAGHPRHQVVSARHVLQCSTRSTAIWTRSCLEHRHRREPLEPVGTGWEDGRKCRAIARHWSSSPYIVSELRTAKPRHEAWARRSRAGHLASLITWHSLSVLVCLLACPGNGRDPDKASGIRLFRTNGLVILGG